MEEATQAPPGGPAPRVIPTPPDFPINWAQPEDTRLFWAQDKMHYPGQNTRFDAELITNWVNVGMAHAAEHYQQPIRIRAGIFNTYYYNAAVPRFRTPDEAFELEQRCREIMAPVLARLGSFWEDEILAEVKQHLAFWEGFDLRGASSVEFAAHLAETERRLHRVTQLHFLFALPLSIANVAYDDTYRQLFAGDDSLEGFRLLEGFDNITLRSNREVWRLSREVLASPELREVFNSRPSSEVVAALNDGAAGETFLAHLTAYLNEYGQRFETWGLSRPSMLEDPAPVIDVIKSYMAQPEFNPETMLANSAAERERRVADVRRRLEGYPSPARQQFERDLTTAQVATVLAEDHNYWIDFRAPYEVRRVALEAGRRLVEAGAIDEADDVFHLSFAELIESFAGHDASSSHRQTQIAERKAELEHFASIQPPPAFGTEPPGPPPDMVFTRFAAKFFGRPPAPSERPDILNGMAGAAGVVRGTACVVQRLSEAGRLRPGDILVAPTTAPAWTPLFAIAAGIVTDAGGPLSHCAVVAREYGIPAVVGTGMASAVLRDGQMIEVDGNAGVVRIIGGD